MIRRLAEFRRRTVWAGVVAALVGGAVLASRTFRADASDVAVHEARELPTYSATEAAEHLGERAVVCGRVASATYASRVGGRPTFLNLGRPYPDQLFTVVIWGRNRAKFGEPEARFRDRDICAAGTIEEHRGTPQIEAREPGQLRICEGRC